jgi:hypothetical protein
VETLKISVSTKYFNSVEEFISEFPAPKLGGTCRIIDNICQLLRAVTHSFEVNDRYLTKTLMGFSHLLLETFVDTTVLPNNELTVQQNQIG